jgi:hypothetical protein
MLSLALSLAVMSSSGGLLEQYTPVHVRLLESPASEVPAVLLGQYAPRSNSPYVNQGPPMSLEAMRAEYARLEESLPGLVAPIVLLSLAGGLLITSAIFWSTLYEVLLIVGVFTFIGAVACGIAGGIILGTTLGRRHRINRDMNQLQAQIRAMEQSGGSPLPQGPVPPPPPPPQTQGFTPVEASYAVLDF